MTPVRTPLIEYIEYIACFFFISSSSHTSLQYIAICRALVFFSSGRRVAPVHKTRLGAVGVGLSSFSKSIPVVYELRTVIIADRQQFLSVVFSVQTVYSGVCIGVELLLANRLRNVCPCRSGHRLVKNPL